MPKESAVRECLERIRSDVSGDVREDPYSRMFYSTDASIYQVDPLGVVIPKTREDVHAVVEAAAEFRVPVLARASGSSLAGQAVGAAIVVDFTRHLDSILEVDVHKKTARVEPGVVLGNLNTHLAPMGLQFGPDPASANRAAMGGVVSNNSTGAHSIVYGMTADHVLETNVILGDGARASFGPRDSDQIQRVAGQNSEEGRIYRQVFDLTTDRAVRSSILENTPTHWRRCGGYNLDRLVGAGPSFRVAQDPRFNLAKLVCGAEGTLAIIEDVTVRLVPIPSVTGLGIVHFDYLKAALESIPSILETGPTAIELLDRLGMSLCRNVSAWRKKLEGFVEGDPDCVLITEFSGENEDEIIEQLDRLERRLKHEGGTANHVVRVLSTSGQSDVWAVRKMGLGFLMSMKGDYKPIPFIEDAAVPPEHLAEYVLEVERFCKSIGTDIAYYAHASAGCVHIRPLINAKLAAEVAKLPEITSFAIGLLHGFGGALSSEHGDGRARSSFNEAFFGPDLYQAYRSVKQIFDPQNLFNPGNIVDAGPMTENLRFGDTYKVPPLETHLDFTAELGLDRAVEMCNGAGVCRKMNSGTMCPSFIATREEEHSTRGRANALRAVMTGSVASDGFGDKRLYETMDLCLECKACVSECPSSVDMAKLKAEFLAQYQAVHGVSRRSRIFANVARSGRTYSGKGAGVINGVLKNRTVRNVLERTVGITAERAFPPFAKQSFVDWFSSRKHNRSSQGPVVLFNDTFNTYNYPDVAIAATKFLEACGYEVLLPGHRCCGRPMISKGLINDARAAAAETVAALIPFVDDGLKIIGLEPSCLLSFGDEYAALLPGDDRVKRVAEASMLFDEFVVRAQTNGEISAVFSSEAAEILYHGHCHQKALVGTEASLLSLSLPRAYRVREINSGCCGMAGSFGFEAEHYHLSMRIGEERLFPTVRAAPSSSTICVSGVSCRQQIEHATGRKPVHIAEVLWKALGNAIHNIEA